MEQKDKLIYCVKISQKENIERLSNGIAWFADIKTYVNKAVKQGNNEQGDLYEGIFARCDKSSSLITEMKSRFGDNLELIYDNNSVFLRRKSALNLHAFCCYVVKWTDMRLLDKIYYEDGVPIGIFGYSVNTEMYCNFLQKETVPSDIYGYYCSAGHLFESIEGVLNKSHYRWQRKMIEYDIDLNTNFFIEPTDDYTELFHKRKNLSYQNESRIVVYNANNQNGFSIKFNPISKESGSMAVGELYIKSKIKLEELQT